MNADSLLHSAAGCPCLRLHACAISHSEIEKEMLAVIGSPVSQSVAQGKKREARDEEGVHAELTRSSCVLGSKVQSVVRSSCVVSDC